MKLDALATLLTLMTGVIVTVTVSTLQLLGLMTSHSSYLRLCVPAGLAGSTVTAPVLLFRWM